MTVSNLPDSAVVEEALEDICSRPPFHSSNQCQALLRYIVKNSLLGQEDLLRERVIGAEVFHRPPNYDCGNDPIVRTRAAEVRKRLAQYYLQSGKPAVIRIDVPSGGYRATFEIREGLASSDITEAETPVPWSMAQEEVLSSSEEVHAGAIRVPSPSKRNLTIAASLAVVFSGILLTFSLLKTSSHDNFRAFWQPLLTTRSPATIYLGTNHTYCLTPAFHERYRKKWNLPDDGIDAPVDLSHEAVSASDLTPSAPLIGLSDTAAASRIAYTFAEYHEPYDLRYGSDLGVTDLQAAPAVLIGGFSNRRALEMLQVLRFRLEHGDRIVDHGQKNRSWIIRYSPDGRVVDDYVVVSRIPKSETGGFVLAITGVATFSNQAAADFVSDANRMNTLLHDAPIGWQRMNMQIVLHTRAVEMIPVSTDVEAVAYW